MYSPLKTSAKLEDTTGCSFSDFLETLFAFNKGATCIEVFLVEKSIDLVYTAQ